MKENTSNLSFPLHFSVEKAIFTYVCGYQLFLNLIILSGNNAISHPVECWNALFEDPAFLIFIPSLPVELQLTTKGILV